MLNIASSRIGVKIKDRLFRSIDARNRYAHFAPFQTIFVTAHQVSSCDKTGTLLSMLSEDVQVLEQGYGADVGRSAQFAAQFIAGLVMAFVRSWQVRLRQSGDTIRVDVLLMFVCLSCRCPL